MKNFFIALIKKPIYIVFLIILIFYFPTGLSAPPEGLDRQQISTIGIDQHEEGVEVSVLSYVSNQTEKYFKKYLLTSTTAENIPNAFNKIGSITGRKVSLAHASVIVLGEEIAKQGAHNYLDFFYRNENLTDDTYLICTLGKAKDLLNFEKERVNSTGFGLEEVSVFNSQNVYFTDNNIESFFKGYFSPVNASVIALAELEENSDVSQLADTPQEESASEGSGQGQNEKNKTKRIKKINNLGIFKEGKFVGALDENLMLGHNIINPLTKNINFEIKNFSDEHFENANINFNIEFNNVKVMVNFENNKPVIHYSLFTGLTIENIVSEKLNKNYFKNNINLLSDKLKNKIENQLKKNFADLVVKLREYKTDVIGVYAEFNNRHYFKFKEWYENLENKDEFLNFVEFRMNINPVLTT